MPLAVDIASAYKLTTVELSPRDLLLDPRNPRLVTDDFEDNAYTEQELADTTTQRDVLDRVCQREHHVQSLIESIRQKGFIGGMQAVIVKRLLGIDKYLVLEGNRRTAAMQLLLNRPGELSPEVRSTIERIEVKQFLYVHQDGLDEEEVIDVLLGTIHVDGPQAWGAMQKAHYVHRSYRRAFAKAYKDDTPLFYDTSLAKLVGKSFNLTAQSVRKLVTIHRVYDQLRDAGFDVKADHYTLIDLATKTRQIKSHYFETDSDLCQMSQLGLSRFGRLCIEEGRPVHNPKLFRLFSDIYEFGTALDIEDAFRGNRPLVDIWDRIEAHMQQRLFRNELEIIKEALSSLTVSEYRATAEEDTLIRKIDKLVEKRLRKLLR